MQNISGKTHSRSILFYKRGVAIFEITRDGEVDQSKNRFYVVSYDSISGQVYSVLPSDNPDGNRRWMARSTPWGVAYVANGRTLSAAKSAYYRHLKKTTKAI